MRMKRVGWGRVTAMLALAVLTALAWLRPPETGTDSAWQEAARRTAQQLHAQARQAALAGDPSTLARPDGYLYAIDLSQLALYATQHRDAALYEALQQLLVEHFLLDDPDDPFTRGFIAWRWRPGAPLEASGTTEMLRTAEALWHASDAFHRPQDRQLAQTILQGYARHQAVDQGVWLIRNYFNLDTRAFATNSYLIDYDPDFLMQAAQATGDAQLLHAAQQSARMVQRARTPAGLLHQIIQPELLTLMPVPGSVFSANNVESLANAAAVAQRSAHSCPQTARSVLQFALARLPHLHAFYDAATGEPADQALAGIQTLAPLVCLAIKLDDAQALAQLRPAFLQEAQALAASPEPAGKRLYLISEALLALEALHRWEKEHAAAELAGE
ncbi:MAG TPA: hypothetical protein VF184_09130 [Phycisphaeraceae bacterium]